MSQASWNGAGAYCLMALAGTAARWGGQVQRGWGMWGHISVGPWGCIDAPQANGDGAGANMLNSGQSCDMCEPGSLGDIGPMSNVARDVPQSIDTSFCMWSAHCRYGDPLQYGEWQLGVCYSFEWPRVAWPASRSPGGVSEGMSIPLCVLKACSSHGDMQRSGGQQIYDMLVVSDGLDAIGSVSGMSRHVGYMLEMGMHHRARMHHGV